MAEHAAYGEFHARQRRSTRILRSVPLTVAATDAAGQPLNEQTATLSVNCHGCRYFSKYRLQKDAWLTLEIPAADAGAQPQRLRARVAWVQRSRNLQGLFQVGVEFEAPGNVWAVESPPEDWQQFAPQRGWNPAEFEREMQRLLELAETGTYYQLLGGTAVSTRAQIKRSFYQLARAFHPDRHMGRREWAAPLQTLMDALTLAYKTLSDETLREKYDQRLAESGVFTLGQNKTEAQRNAEECLEKARELLRAENYAASILWLRKAVEIEPDSSKYHALLARSLAAVPQYRREAVDHFERAIELDSMNAWAHFHFARLYEDLNLPWRAHPHYEKVVELDSEHREASERLRALDAAQATKGAAEPSLLDRFLSRLSK